MSQPTAKSIVAVTLTGINNWLEWRDYIGSRLELATWTAIRAGDQSFLILEPRKPIPADFNPDVQDEAHLSAQQSKSFNSARSHYKEDLEAFKDQQKQLTTARTVIYGSVDQRLAHYLQWHQHVFQWMKALDRAVEIEQSKQTANLAAEYQGILRTFNISSWPAFEAWLLNWEGFLIKGTRYRLLEAVGSRWMYDANTQWTLQYIGWNPSRVLIFHLHRWYYDS